MAVQIKCFPWNALVRLTAEFRNTAGALADPDSVRVRTRDPSAIFDVKVSDIDAELVHDGLGLFHYDVAAIESGNWRYRWQGTGAVTAVAEGQFTIAESEFEGGSPA